MKSALKNLLLYGFLAVSAGTLLIGVCVEPYRRAKTDLERKTAFYRKNLESSGFPALPPKELERREIEYGAELRRISGAFAPEAERDPYRLGQKLKKELENLGFSIERYRSVDRGTERYCEFSVRGPAAAVVRFLYQISFSKYLMDVSGYQFKVGEQGEALFSFRVAYAKI